MDHIADLHRDGLALVEAARAAGLDAEVAACPGWDVGRLVNHVGRVLERAALVVGERLDANPPRERFTSFPADESALDLLTTMLDGAVDALGAADPADPAWNFTGDDLTAGFWARRMANEIAVHRADAELAAGRSPSVATDRAVDGLDELLTVMLPFSAPLAAEGLDATIHLHCTDAEGEWLAVFRDGTPTTTREHAKGDLAVKGPASPLFLWAWNRAPVGADGLESFGDPALLERWPTLVP